ncbi:secreted and transmembrane protein 1b-like [Acomys russatus]|uniref:secreted and transmembrane protein 1b-like n=1 Tax=Acomys russatus TaxID=60746 RepID=UPI0021E290A4|nr:secreted and transmembrane protein 1b-like [Acomys russatus]
MPAYSITSAGLIPSMLWALLLLAASLNAQNQSWDRLKCTEPKMSVLRGNRVLMACNISNTFQYVTIEWTAFGKTRTIFNKMSPGNYRRDAWQLQIQGGWAQLVITDAQDTHAGQYLWVLRGLQKNITSFTLSITEPQDQEEAGVQKLLASSHSQGLCPSRFPSAQAT